MLNYFKKVLVSVVFMTAPVHAETLTSALVSAYQNSGLLEQNRALLRAADEDVAQAFAAVRPSLTYFASIDWTDSPSLFQDELSGNIGLAAQMTLYDGGQNRLSVEAAQEAVLAARASLIAVEQQVLLRAVVAYMNVRREAQFVQLSENNVRLIEQELQAAEDRFEVGEVTRTELSLAEARLAASRFNLAAAQGRFVQAREEYRAAIGHYPGELSAPPSLPPLPDSQSSANAIAQRNHPNILQAQHNVTVAELNIQRARTALMPQASASASIVMTDSGNSVASVGVDVGGVIYQGGQIRSLERQAAAGNDAARAALLMTSQAVSQNIGNAWSGLVVAGASIEATERQIRAARVAYNGTREEAALGARTTLDVLDAEQALLDAQTNRVSSGIDQQIAAYSLLSAMGRLTVRHLGLGITTYDPADYYDAVSSAPTRAPSEQGQRLDDLLQAIGR